jgi:archaellum component FlaC
VGFSIYFGIIVDHKRVETMETLTANDVELQGHKTVIDEDYRRLDLRFQGRGKHIQKMQRDIVSLRERLRTVSDSLGNKIEETNFFLQQVEEMLREDIRNLNSELRTLTDDLTTYKRRTNRTVLDMQEVISRIEDDLKALDEQVNPEKDKDREND